MLVAPVIDLTNLGVDTNVFNQPADQAQEDFTFTLSPRADVWMKVGPTWISGNIREDLIWYETFASERAANTSAAVNWIVPLNRLRFSVGTAYLWARDRPSYEIDARVPRVETQINGAAEVRALSRTFFGVQAGRRHVDFQEGARFVDTALRVELNRVTTNVTVNARNELTPLTSISIDVGRMNDRFDYAPNRDADSTMAGVQVMFDPSALIKGSARVGYRDFEPLDHSVPSYQGATVAVDLSYVLLGSTKFGIQLSRDVQVLVPTSTSPTICKTAFPVRSSSRSSDRSTRSPAWAFTVSRIATARAPSRSTRIASTRTVPSISASAIT